METRAPPVETLSSKELLRNIKARMSEEISYAELVAIVRALIGILEKML